MTTNLNNDQGVTDEYKWIEEGLQKRTSNFSNVICFETQDPKRHDQLLEHLPKCGYCKGSDCFLYDPWNGLMRLNPATEDFEPCTRDVGGGYDRVPEDITTLAEALKEMDKKLKSRKTIFLLRHLEDCAENERLKLKDAFRDWALNKRIMEKGSLVILLTGNLTRVLDELTSNLIALIMPGLSTEGERRKIIEDVGRKLEVDMTKDDIESLVIATSGLNLHQVRCVLLESFNTTGKFERQKIKDSKAAFIRRTDLVTVIEPEPIVCPKCQFENLPSAINCDKCGQHLKERRSFARVGGYERVKEFVLDEIIKALKEPEIFHDLGLPVPRGILLFGPPGTGKSIFANALAEEAHIPFINLRTENLYSMWLGESGRRFRDAIRLVEQMSPAICFIDEIEHFGKRSGGEFGPGGAGEETRRVFNQVLEWLGDEKRKAIIVGATNRPGDLDDAFKRPGRIDYKIPFLYPDKKAREEIFKVHLGLSGPKRRLPKMKGMANIADLLEDLSVRTTCYTGAEIEQIVLRAKRKARKDGRHYLMWEDFKGALENFRIDWKKRLQDLEYYIDQAKEECNDQDLLKELLPEELKVFLEEAKSRLETGRGFSLQEAITKKLPLF